MHIMQVTHQPQIAVTVTADVAVAATAVNGHPLDFQEVEELESLVQGELAGHP